MGRKAPNPDYSSKQTAAPDGTKMLPRRNAPFRRANMGRFDNPATQPARGSAMPFAP
jgi:hypothetical protein